MDNNNEVSVLIKTKAEDANSSVSKLISNLENVSGKLDKISLSLDKITSGSNKTGNSVKKAKKELNSMSNISSKLQTSFNKAFDVGKLYLYWNVTKRIRDSMAKLINSSISYIETQNLFDVSMKSQSENAYRFMNTMANTFGMARTQLMEYQASFNNIMKSLPGLADETSYILSETLTKMSLDYSSIFNVDMAKSMEKFQAALVGTVKPIRDKTGLDITEKTLQSVATNIGVEKTVSSLNQVEKRLLRIIALQNQMGEIGAVGDLAKTLESPSNQLKVLNQQLQELGVWLGNAFIGTIGKVLPYINGFVMALVAMAKALAIFVGYTETKYDSDPLQVEDTTNSVENLGTSLGGATAKAKELKKQLMGFDVLNVITTPDESSGGGGASGPSEIDPAILNALKEYDNLMDGVRMKANDIRDRIMEWLGFEKIVNEETGEITWKLKDGETNFEKILNTIKVMGVIIAGLFILKKVAQLIKLFREIYSIFTVIKGLKLFKDMAFAIEAVSSGAATVGEAIKFVLQPIIEFATTVAGIGMVIAGVILAFKNFFDMLKNGFNAIKEILMVLGIALAAVGAIILGVPALVAGIVAAVVAVLATIVIVVKQNWESIKTFFDNLGKKIKEIFTNITNWIYEKAIKPITDFFVGLWNELTNIFSKVGNWVDENVIQPVISVISPIINKIREIVDTIWQIIKAVFGFLANWIYENVIQPIFNFLNNMFEKIRNVISNIWEGIKNLFTNIINWVSNVVNSIWNSITSVFSQIAGWIYHNVVEPVKNFFMAAWEAVGNAVSGIIRGAVNAALTGVENVINFFIRGLNAVVSIVNNLPGVNINYINPLYLPRFADGGLPGVGQMFIAREAGPELVGTIGNRSAIVNNDQIVQSVSQGVAQAVASVLGTQGGNYNFYLDSQQITAVVTRRQNRNLSVMGV